MRKIKYAASIDAAATGLRRYRVPTGHLELPARRAAPFTPTTFHAQARTSPLYLTSPFMHAGDVATYAHALIFFQAAEGPRHFAPEYLGAAWSRRSATADYSAAIAAAQEAPPRYTTMRDAARAVKQPRRAAKQIA